MATDIKPFDVSDTNVSHVVIELFGGDNNLSDFVDEDLDEIVAKGLKGGFAVLGLADFEHAGGQIVEVTAKGLRVLDGRRDRHRRSRDARQFLARALVTYAKVPHRALGFWDHGTGVFDERDRKRGRARELARWGSRRGARPRGQALRVPRAASSSRASRPVRRTVEAMLHDQTSGGVLTNVEAAGVLRAAFKRAGQTRKLDMIFSDTCLNGMVEVLDQLEPFAKVVIGSEELEPGDGWDYERFSGR